ncbi:MAG: thioredoxin fold domain-containing protein [Pseudomonadota bacterium]|jgi:thioredoxin-related protein
MRILFALLGLALSLVAPAGAQTAASHAIDIPPWFVDTFLDLRDDVRDAARDGKRLMLYFGQDGCPYCTQLMQTNFTQPAIAAKTRQHFLPVALNLWGDREVTWLDGKVMSEKELARQLKVQFTPTLLFFDENGQVIVRLNGYYPPHRFEAVLDYVAGRMEKRQSLADYLSAAVKEGASAELHDEPFFLKPPYDLKRKRGGKPLVVLFETRYCSGCDELHREGLRRPEVRALVARFDVARFVLSERTELVTPDGGKTRADEWARALKVAYTPTMVFFDDSGREIFRIEAYLRPFHLASSFEYVASGAYRREPSFQRFIQARAQRLRDKGQAVELWK